MATNYAKLVEDYIKAASSPVDLYAAALGASGASTQGAVMVQNFNSGAAVFKKPPAISMRLRKVKRLERRMDIARAASKAYCNTYKREHYQKRSCLRNIHMPCRTKALIKNRSIHKLVQTGVKL